MAKETLINDAGVAPLPSFILSNVLPWLLVALTYNAALFEAFVNWSGLLILGYANFSLPLLLDLKLKRVRAVMRSAIGADADDATTITTFVFILVTASITMVIVMSVFDNLTLSLGSFVLLIGLMVSGTIFEICDLNARIVLLLGRKWKCIEVLCNRK